jgi:hypothetical protein
MLSQQPFEQFTHSVYSSTIQSSTGSSSIHSVSQERISSVNGVFDINTTFAARQPVNPTATTKSSQ